MANHLFNDLTRSKTATVFKYKENSLDQRDYVVEKVIPLSGPEYDAFSRNLLRDHDFIRDNAGLMHRDADGTMHCLLVTGENRRDGILVESEGYNYARYAALLPDVQDWLVVQSQSMEICTPEPDQSHKSPALDSLCERLNQLVDHVAEQVQLIGPDRPFTVDLTEAELDFGIQILGSASLCHTIHAMLCERPDLADLDFQWDKNEIIFTRMEPEMDPGPTMSM